ncbi:hypothetical protein ACFQH6_11500 [Halobacteriaceae archaeon GCM10025711]
MSKVSIGLRGWRFDEEEVFDDEGNFRPLQELPEDTRDRLVRLTLLVDKPCDACWLVHGDEHLDQCNVPQVVYGEPEAEVLVCADHESDFYYWFFEQGGEEHAGTREFREAFHEWFADGGRAPEGYVGVEHVETEPESLPDPETADPYDFVVDLEDDERDRIDLKDVDLDADYPT